MTDRLLKPIISDRLTDLLNKARRVVITCHLSPDGDAMGASLGLNRVLRNMGIFTTVISPDTPPKYLTFLPGAQEIVAFSRNEPLARKRFDEADVVFCLDYNQPERIDLVKGAMIGAPGVKVMIDHHLDPSAFPDIVISHPELSSTSVMVYRVLSEIGLERYIDREAAECIYTGMMTDTGNFSYNSDDPVLYEVIARLLRLGIDKDAIYKKVYFNNSPNRLRLNGYALCEKFETFPEHHASLITLTRDELNRFNYQKGDTEDLVNRPLTVPSVTYSFFLREESNYIKVSARSKGDFPVNKMCEEHFNGGGHLNAAGGEFYGTMEQCVAEFRRVMPLFDGYLPQNQC